MHESRTKTLGKCVYSRRQGAKAAGNTGTDSLSSDFDRKWLQVKILPVKPGVRTDILCKLVSVIDSTGRGRVT